MQGMEGECPMMSNMMGNMGMMGGMGGSGMGGMMQGMEDCPMMQNEEPSEESSAGQDSGPESSQG